MIISIRQLNYFYLTLVILWEPFNLAFLNIDGKGRILFLITIIAFLMNLLHDKSFIKTQIMSRPLYLWGIWVLYSTINLLLIGYQEELPFVYFVMPNLFIPFFTMVVARKEAMRDRKKLLKLISIVFIIFAIFSVTILSNGQAAESDLNSGFERSVGALGNAGPLTALFLVFFFGLRYVNKWIKLSTLIPITIFTITIITLSGTRKAFGALLLILLSIVVSKFKLSFKNIFFTIILSIGVNFGYNYVMQNTVIGERFDKGVGDGERFNTTNYEALDVLGDRAFFYINGWSLFLEHPSSGVGLRNYMRETGSDYVLHTEYIVQLAEGGIIGFTLFLLFYVGIGKRIVISWKNYKTRRTEIWLFIGAFGAILFVNITAWTYSFPHYFLIFGIILGYLESIKIENNNLKYIQRRKKSVMKKSSFLEY